MKVLIVTLALVACVAADWVPLPQQERRQIRLNCLKESNLSQDLIEKAALQEFPETDKVKQYILCGGRGSQLWQDNKGWNADRILTMLEHDDTMTKTELLDNIKACLDDNSQGSSLEDWAYRNYKCMSDGKLKEPLKNMLKKIE